MKSSLPFTSVVSLHTNTFGCGVAKFSQQLAERLGVPFIGVSDDWGDYPLLSLKWSECIGHEGLMDKTVNRWNAGRSTAAFWHDAGGAMMASWCHPNYFADPSLGTNGLWCPTILQPIRHRPIRLFSFGMANKIQTERYRLVQRLLEASGQSYHLRVSIGVHDGTRLSDAVDQLAVLVDIMGAPNVTILGSLTDDAVCEELHAADGLLAFFETGARANNTTIHAAITFGVPVVTNHDEYTIEALRAKTINVDTLTTWPTRGELANRGRQLRRFTWDSLIKEMECIYAATLALTKDTP